MGKKSFNLLLVLTLLFIPALLFSQVDTAWVRRYNGPGDSTDVARAIAVDADGNVYVTGYSEGSGTYFDYATLKYDANGNLLWVRRYNGPGNGWDEAVALAVDAYGNVYVTGRSYGGSGTNDDYATLKYDSNGNLLWERRYNGTGNGDDWASALAVDAYGNVYVTGQSWGSGTYTDYVTLKYDRNGNLLWEKRYNGTANYLDRAYALAVDVYGNVCVTGYSYGYASSDYATLKYNSNGNLLWVRRYNGPSWYDEATALAVDNNGNVYVTGRSDGLGINHEYATLKYNANGNLLWERRYRGPYGLDMPYALAIDNNGNLYVTGYSHDSATSADYLTLKYDANGNLLWERKYNGTGNFWDGAYDLVVDGNGNVYVTGRSYGSGTNYDYVTLKYDSNGNLLWEKRYNGPANYIDEALALAIDANSNVYVTGFSYGSGTFADYVTIKYIQEPGISEEKIDKIENRPVKRIDKIYDITGKIVKEKLKKGIYFNITEKGKEKIKILILK